MSAEMFADGIERITTQGGVVRIDYVSVSPGSAGHPAIQQRQRIIMSLQGFVNAFATLQEMVQKLAKAEAVALETNSPIHARPVTGPSQ